MAGWIFEALIRHVFGTHDARPLGSGTDCDELLKLPFRV